MQSWMRSIAYLSNSLQFFPSEAQILSNFFLTQFKFFKEEFPTKRFPCRSTWHRAILTDIPTHNTPQRKIFISKGYSDSVRGGFGHFCSQPDCYCDTCFGGAKKKRNQFTLVFLFEFKFRALAKVSLPFLLSRGRFVLTLSVLCSSFVLPPGFWRFFVLDC